uniref:Calcium channel, voltage-dependent, alpha 2/delta subunit 1a n=1 Tax=Xiphophorus couchianus TaxID=32473 RepID=A0A3B5M1W5_9TELE
MRQTIFLFCSPCSIKDWVFQIQKDLITLTDKASGLEDLIKIYHKHKTHFSVESNDARKLVATAAGNIDKLLANRSEALKVLFHLNSFAQVNKTALKEKEKDKDKDKEEDKSNRFIPEDFEIDPDFKRLVSYNTTAVHIPTDIYEGSTIILNELNWTDELEDVFRQNKEDDPSLLWQVFGSATGLARYYPASPWNDKRSSPDKIDLYDVRRRPWYIQGAASPKDMLILVDASGSVSGLTLKLIKTSVSWMLETLSDDDFVNVVSFNKTARPAACFQNLVQANVRNKRVLKEAVHRLKAEGITNYTSGFELAFEQLAQTNVSRADCNKIIMLFTDGGEERAEEIFQKYNPKQEVRIFTFSVGQHSYDKGPIQWMACNNKGYYYEIPSIGAIRLNTQEYLDVLGRPMVKADSGPKRGRKASKQVQWTNVYLDALELGLVITGTLPVFNKTDTGSKSQNQLILGVMAIDVSLEDIKRLTPRFTFGPNGYYFAIDPNGYVLLHPNLQPLTAKFDEPVTLDFLDAELENDIKVEMRNKMIDGKTGNYTISTLVKSQDERYIDEGERTYTFAPVRGTDYSLALVLPNYSMHYIRATIGDTITQAKCKLTFTSQLKPCLFYYYTYYVYTFVFLRMYCKDLKPPDKETNNTEYLMDFNNYIDTKTPNNPMCKCNRTLFTAFSLLVRQGVIARFVATDGGITRVFPKSAGLDWKEDAETYESSFYKRSLDNDVYIFTPTRCTGKPVKYQALYNQGCFLKRFVGVKLDIYAWMESFINITYRMNVSTVDVYRHEVFKRSSVSMFDYCVVLDDGGFMVMSNQEDYVNQIGCFFGIIDPDLMRTLVNSSLFTAKSTYDYQSLCEPKRESKAAAGLRSIYVPTIADILDLGWWATAAVCITEQTQYFFENDETSFGGLFECANSTRQYLAEKVPNTNLVLIISDRQQGNSQSSAGPDPCEMALSPRYRKGPIVCFDKTEHEDPDCGGVSGLTPSLWLMVVIQVVLLWAVTDSRHYAIPS